MVPDGYCAELSGTHRQARAKKRAPSKKKVSPWQLRLIKPYLNLERYVLIVPIAWRLFAIEVVVAYFWTTTIYKT